MSRLSITLNPDAVAESKETAGSIVEDVFSFIVKHTTDSIERTVLRFFGIDGVDAGEVPLPNVVVDHLKRKAVLDTGSAYWVANACVAYGKEPQSVAQQVGRNELDLTKVPSQPLEKVYSFGEQLTKKALDRVDKNQST